MLRFIIISSLIIITSAGCSTTKKAVTNKTELKDEPEMPAINAVVTKRVWIPDKLDGTGTRLEKGHWLFLIERQSTWSN